MSSFDRNVGHNVSHHVSLQEVFDDWRLHQNNAEQGEELPNQRIEWRINLNQSNVPAELVNKLENIDMAVTKPNRHMDIIIISGIPPVNGFGQQQVLEIVRQYVPNAILA